MNAQLQHAYDALEQAHNAGNAEDAQQIADYIRELQAQEEGGSADMMYPAGGAAIGVATGAIAGPIVGSAVDTAVTKAAEKVTGPKGTPRGDAVAKWLATQTTGPNAGGATFKEAFKKSETARGVPVQSRGSNIPIRKGFAGIQNQPAEPTLPQKAAANVISSEKLGPPGLARRVGGMGVAGAEAGKFASDISQGNYGDAAISGLGTIGGAMSQSRIKPIRAIGTGLSTLIPLIQGGKELKDVIYTPPPPKEEPEQKAAGGLVYMAAGKLVGAGKSVAAKMSPGMNFGNPAPIEAPMLRPSGSGSLLPKVSDPYIAHHQDILPQVRLKNPKPDSRMSRLESDPRAHQAIQDAIKAGVNIDPKLANWYGTNALLTGMLNEGRQFGNFEQFMKHMASSSQRNPVPQQNKMGSYLAYLENMGQIGNPGTKLALPKGYGSLAQGDIVNRSQRIAAGEYPFDDAIKLGKFYKSYMGYHPNNAVVDVIGTRVPTMATRDPDWLVSRLQIGTDAKGNKQIINPKAMYESGELSMEEALKRPGFWEAAPKLTGEYAGLEDMWKLGSKNAKQPHAGSGQALGWYGSAGLEDSAGLKSKPMTWVESLEKSARDRATITGENPLDVMNKVLKGTGHFKKGGSTTPAWQRSEGKSPSGGLNALGRASYKRETGGELKAPQPEGGSRKKSFCARMGGMKKKLTSSKTANDPDSRINKALRKWKC
jgi:hypothetical protein